MSLLQACTAVLIAGGGVTFPYRPSAGEWVLQLTAYRLDEGFVVYDPYAGQVRFATAEQAAARLLELLRKMPPECLLPREEAV
jgi:predicted flavoprotein YhiN